MKKFFALLFIFCFGMTGLSHTDEANFRKKCQTCHKRVLGEWDAAKVVHFPYAEGSCESCHSSKHKKFTGEINELCLICHDLDDAVLKKSHFNANVEGVACTSCHYTHGSDRKAMFKESVHEPFSSGMCDACHEVTPEGKLKQLDGMNDICLTCHDGIVAKDEKVIHPAFEMLECTNCHNPHTSPDIKLLKKPVSEVCFECHEPMVAKKHPYDVTPSKKIIKNEALFAHGGHVTCVSCHKPHASKLPVLLKESIDNRELCYKCHKK